MDNILVAGATGMLGRHVCRQLQAGGQRVSALVRRPTAEFHDVVVADLQSPESLRGCCSRAGTVISCAGASMSLRRRAGRASFPDVDFQGNTNLLTEAKHARVRKFVYVSLNPAGAANNTIYVDAHEQFVRKLKSSGIEYTVVRPTGFFGFYAEALAAAKNGRALVIGPGTARTNPIHEADVARACIEAIDAGRTELAVGGPDVFTRREVAELALTIAGSSNAPWHVPAWIFRAMLPMLRLADRRLHALFEFGIEVTLNDCIAPAYGTHRLADYLRTAFAPSKTAAV